MIGIIQFPRLAVTEQNDNDDPADEPSNSEIEVLVVDDEEAVLRMLGTGLRMFGLKVRMASSGKEAVELFHLHQATIDVVLTDVMMPGMEGPETLHEIQAIAPRTPVLFMTANSGRYTTEDLMELGGWDVLAKPFRSLANVAARLPRPFQA